MNDFLHSLPLALTPLTPIHIGCSEDYEPTGYTVHDGVLFCFDPAQATLNRQEKNELIRLGEQGNLLGIQRFFRDKPAFREAARKGVPVTREISQLYEKSLAPLKEDKRNHGANNRLDIQRTAYHPQSEMPYVPGSALKGAIRTAVLDRLLKNSREAGHGWPEKRADQLEQRLLGLDRGDFSRFAFRFLKIADMQPQGQVRQQVIMAHQHKKKAMIDQKTGKAKEGGVLPVRKEVILPGQYCCFGGSLQLAAPHPEAMPPVQLKSASAIAQDCNNYYLPQLEHEWKLLEARRLVSTAWLARLRTLFASGGEIRCAMEAGQVFLVRLGMLGGAESKTYRSVPDFASIKIMRGKGQQPNFRSETTTVWLGYLDGGEQPGGQPFGWALAEIAPRGDMLSLRAWCEEESRHHPDFDHIRQAVEATRGKALARKQQREAEAREQAARRRQEEAENQARAAQLAAMSACDREIADIAELIGKVKKGDAGGTEARLCRERLEVAAATWQDKADRQKLADSIAPLLKQKDLTSKKFKTVLQQLRNPS